MPKSLLCESLFEFKLAPFKDSHLNQLPMPTAMDNQSTRLQEKYKSSKALESSSSNSTPDYNGIKIIYRSMVQVLALNGADNKKKAFTILNSMKTIEDVEFITFIEDVIHDLNLTLHPSISVQYIAYLNSMSKLLKIKESEFMQFLNFWREDSKNDFAATKRIIANSVLIPNPRSLHQITSFYAPLNQFKIKLMRRTAPTNHTILMSRLMAVEPQTLLHKSPISFHSIETALSDLNVNQSQFIRIYLPYFSLLQIEVLIDLSSLELSQDSIHLLLGRADLLRKYDKLVQQNSEFAYFLRNNDPNSTPEFLKHADYWHIRKKISDTTRFEKDSNTIRSIEKILGGFSIVQPNSNDFLRIVMDILNRIETFKSAEDRLQVLSLLARMEDLTSLGYFEVKITREKMTAPTRSIYGQILNKIILKKIFWNS